MIGRAPGFATHALSCLLHVPTPCFVMGHTHKQEHARPDERASARLSRSAGAQRTVSPSKSMLLSHEFPWTHLAWADHERHSGDVPTWRGVRSPGCLLSRMCVSMTLMPNTQRRPTTLIKRKPSAKPSACLPARSEKRPATRTLGFSRKRAPLRHSRCLSCSASLASPKQAQLRSAPRT